MTTPKKTGSGGVFLEIKEEQLKTPSTGRRTPPHMRKKVVQVEKEQASPIKPKAASDAGSSEPDKLEFAPKKLTYTVEQPSNQVEPEVKPELKDNMEVKADPEVAAAGSEIEDELVFKLSSKVTRPTVAKEDPEVSEETSKEVSEGPKETEKEVKANVTDGTKHDKYKDVDFSRIICLEDIYGDDLKGMPEGLPKFVLEEDNGGTTAEPQQPTTPQNNTSKAASEVGSVEEPAQQKIEVETNGTHMDDASVSLKPAEMERLESRLKYLEAANTKLMIEAAEGSKKQEGDVVVTQGILVNVLAAISEQDAAKYAPLSAVGPIFSQTAANSDNISKLIHNIAGNNAQLDKIEVTLKNLAAKTSKSGKDVSENNGLILKLAQSVANSNKSVEQNRDNIAKLVHSVAGNIAQLDKHESALKKYDGKIKKAVREVAETKATLEKQTESVFANLGDLLRTIIAGIQAGQEPIDGLVKSANNTNTALEKISTDCSSTKEFYGKIIVAMQELFTKCAEILHDVNRSSKVSARMNEIVQKFNDSLQELTSVHLRREVTEALKAFAKLEPESWANAKEQMQELPPPNLRDSNGMLLKKNAPASLKDMDERIKDLHLKLIKFTETSNRDNSTRARELRDIIAVTTKSESKLAVIQEKLGCSAGSDATMKAVLAALQKMDKRFDEAEAMQNDLTDDIEKLTTMMKYNAIRMENLERQVQSLASDSGSVAAAGESNVSRRRRRNKGSGEDSVVDE